VLREASGGSIMGWVSNETDGSVRCVAEGLRIELESLVAALRAGPPGARVDSVTVSWSAATGAFSGFGVRSRGHRGD
jgi:acylphosphatase